MKKIVIAGGTGFIGKHLHKRFEEEGCEVLLISRGNQHINWNDDNAILKALEGADALINLAGKSVDADIMKRTKLLSSVPVLKQP